MPGAGDERADAAVGHAALQLTGVELVGGRETVGEEAAVVLEPLDHLGGVERVLRAVGVGELGAGRPGERHHRLPGAGVAGLELEAVRGAGLLLQVGGELAQLVPRGRRLRPAGLLREVGAVVEGPRLDVPGDAVRRAADLGGLPGAGEEVALLDQPLGRRFDPAGLRELTHPRGADQAHVRRLARRDRVGDLVVRAVPRHRGDLDLRVGVRFRERRREVLEDLALGAHRPDLDRAAGLAVIDGLALALGAGFVAGVAAAAGQGQAGDGEQRGDAVRVDLMGVRFLLWVGWWWFAPPARSAALRARGWCGPR